MPLVVPYAAARADEARRVLAGLALPALTALLARCDAPQLDIGDPLSLSPPHERVLARLLGWHGDDGALPWAAHAAAQAGIEPGDTAWGLAQPVHWRVGSDEVGLVDPAALALGDDESRALFDAVEPLVTSAGFRFVRLDALRWLVGHDSLRTLRTASIDRVIGRDVERWLPRGAPAWSRLHSELQMAWYREPVNERREARGDWPVNALWLSGCGVRQRTALLNALRIDDRLRAPALAGDWHAWGAAWQALDHEVLASAVREGSPVVLCGEAGSVTLAPAVGWWPRLRGTLRGTRVATVLEPL